MNGLANFLTMINENWTMIVIVLTLILAIAEKFRRFVKMSKEERVEAALKAVKSELISLMAEAEIYWEDYKKSGLIKKSKVISEIYAKYPILKEYISQDELIEKITAMIDEEKAEMDKIINNIPTKIEEK